MSEINLDDGDISKSERLEKEPAKASSTRLIKRFNNQIRRLVNESYEAYHTTLEGVILTSNHEQFIKTRVNNYLEMLKTES